MNSILSLCINSAFVLYAFGHALVLVSKFSLRKRVALARERPNEKGRLKNIHQIDTNSSSLICCSKHEVTIGTHRFTCQRRIDTID